MFVIRCTDPKMCKNLPGVYIKSEDYQYMWSLNHGKNSGIIDINYPMNYLKAIEDTLNSGIEVVIDVDKLDPIILCLEDREIKIVDYDNINIEIPRNPRRI